MKYGDKIYNSNNSKHFLNKPGVERNINSKIVNLQLTKNQKFIEIFCQISMVYRYLWKKYAELIIELINTKKSIVDWIYSEIDDESNTYSTNGITRNLLFKPHLPS